MLTNLFARKHDPLLQEVIRLSRISSEGERHKGIFKVLQYSAEELKALGFSIKYISGDKARVPLLEATYSASIENPICIGMVCHADTVVGVKKKRQIYIQGQELIGPGVADNKGGIVCLLESLRGFLSQKKHIPFTIKVIISSEEEIGSPSFQSYFQVMKHKLDYVFGFEPALGEGNLINQRNGNYWIQVTAKGKQAHCGRARGEELNAFHDFSQKYQRVLKLLSPHNDLRMNLGSIKSDTEAFNIVCGEIKAKLDIRFSDLEDLNQFLPKLHKAFRSDISKNIMGESVQYEFEVLDFCPPMRNQKSDHGFIAKYLQNVEELEQKRPVFMMSGGASDLCYLSTANNVCLDGFGPLAKGMHRHDESLYIPSLKTRAAAFSSLLWALCDPMEGVYGNSLSS